MENEYLDPDFLHNEHARAWGEPGECDEVAEEILYECYTRGHRTGLEYLSFSAYCSGITVSSILSGEYYRMMSAPQITVPERGGTIRSTYVYHIVPIIDGKVVDMQLSNDIDACSMNIEDYINEIKVMNYDIELEFDSEEYVFRELY